MRPPGATQLAMRSAGQAAVPEDLALLVSVELKVGAQSQVGGDPVSAGRRHDDNSRAHRNEPGRDARKAGHSRYPCVPVELIVRKVAEGASEAALVDACPRLRREDIRAALLFAADSLAHEDILLDPAV